MRLIKPATAQKLCYEWNEGDWSALYQFAKTGQYEIANHLRYLQEIETELHPEYELHPRELTKGAEMELQYMKSYFISKGEVNGIKTEYHKHEIYGYDIPFVAADTKKEITDQITALKYLV